MYEKDSCFVSSYGGIITDIFSTCGRKEQVRKSATTFNVISDIQGDLGDFDHVLKDMNKVTPLSRALIMNGDITPTGQQSQYDDVKRVLNKNKHPRMYGQLLGIMSFMLVNGQLMGSYLKVHGQMV